MTKLLSFLLSIPQGVRNYLYWREVRLDHEAWERRVRNGQ